MPARTEYNYKVLLKAAILYFAAVFGAGVVLGTLRGLWLAPQIGVRAAELVEMPFMLVVMVVAALRIVHRLAVPPHARYRLAMGGIALTLLLATEFALVGPLRGMSINEYLGALDPLSASVYSTMLAVYALLPELMQRGRWYFSHRTALGVCALLAIFLGFAYARYLADLEAAHRRVAAGSEIAYTPCGPIEYAATGQGPVVLLVHGAGGGFDQGAELGAELASFGFRVIAMSRFGYLRTPLPSDASPEAQADAHACLLDALGIDRAATAGVSAGAPSSMQFALRHPDRTTALVLLVPLAYSPRAVPQPSAVARFMYERAVKSDFLYWLMLRIAPGVVVKTILGTPPEVLIGASPSEQQRVARTMEHILPLSRRQAGLLNDAAVALTLAPYELERIATPTLVISLADDLYGTYESAGYTASRIRGARFIGYLRGGHVFVGHQERVLSEVARFLNPAQDPFAIASP
jgi:2-hydroxy-6-oxonona-2,4-dienedioate hydrolase